MIVRTAADVDLCAFHTDPYLNEGRHEHVWNVEIICNGEPFRDARCLKVALSQWLEPYQGADLPPELWAAEDIAKAILTTLGTADPIGCIVKRPGFRVEVWL